MKEGLGRGKVVPVEAVNRLTSLINGKREKGDNGASSNGAAANGDAGSGSGTKSLKRKQPDTASAPPPQSKKGRGRVRKDGNAENESKAASSSSASSGSSSKLSIGKKRDPKKGPEAIPEVEVLLEDPPSAKDTKAVKKWGESFKVDHRNPARQTPACPDPSPLSLLSLTCI